jgi:hypothetical protein
MSFVAAATTVGATVLGTGAAAGIGSTIVGGALIGAGVGGAYSALTGDGNVLDSMLTGAGVGGLAGGIGGAFFPTAAGYAPAAGAVTGAGSSPALTAYANPGISTSKQVADFANASSDPIGALAGSGALSGGAGQTAVTAANTGLTAQQMLGYGLGATTLMGLLGGRQQQGVNVPTDSGDIRPYEYSISSREPEAGQSYYFNPIEYDQYGKTTTPIDTSERNYFNENFTPLPTYKAAQGGQVPQLDNMPAGGLASIQGMRDGYAPMTTFDGNIPQFAFGGILSRVTQVARADDGLPQYYFNPETRQYTRLNVQQQQPVDDHNQFLPLTGNNSFGNIIRRIVNQVKPTEQKSASSISYDPATQRYSGMANGGQVHGFSAGGVNMQDGGFVVPADTVSHFGNGSTDAGLKLLGSRLGAKPIKGDGDGMSDSIAATINGKQPARIADGEAYVPPEMVKKIGKGSPEAGAKRLYNMMDKVRHARTGTKKQGKQIKADKYLPT